jgi:hypothetical protein
MKMKTISKYKYCSIFIVSFLLFFTCKSFAVVTFNPSGSLDFQDVYYGNPDEYTTVSGTATGWGSFTLNQDIEYSAGITIDLTVLIGPESIGGGGSNGWWFDVTGWSAGTYSFGSKDASGSALVWLTEANPTKPVAVSANMFYGFVSDYYPYEWGDQVVASETVTATLSGGGGGVIPEPISSILFVVGGATLGLRRFWKKFKNWRFD